MNKELKIVTEARNKIIDKFKNLSFEEEGHRYFVMDENNNKIEYTPVSNIISQWAIPFDTEGNAERYAIKHGLDKTEVLNDWKFKNLVATTTGTLVHAFGESYAWIREGFPEKINEECKYQYDKEMNWLIPTRPKEFAVKKFWDELDTNLHFVGAELKMSSQYLDVTTLMAGTFDLLLYYNSPNGKSKSGFVLCDYKTNKDLYSIYNEAHDKCMLPPFNDLIDQNLSHYCLQFSAYQLMLESIGIPIIGRRLIWLKDDDYEVIKIDNKTKELKVVL